MRNKKWVRLLAYVTGSVNQELLLQNEYLAAENRILRAKPPSRLIVRAVQCLDLRSLFTTGWARSSGSPGPRMMGENASCSC
jgi:hypothetical protein